MLQPRKSARTSIECCNAGMLECWNAGLLDYWTRSHGAADGSPEDAIDQCSTHLSGACCSPLERMPALHVHVRPYSTPHRQTVRSSAHTRRAFTSRCGWQCALVQASDCATLRRPDLGGEATAPSVRCPGGSRSPVHFWPPPLQPLLLQPSSGTPLDFRTPSTLCQSLPRPVRRLPPPTPSPPRPSSAW